MPGEADSMSLGGHLEVLRQMLIRICLVVVFVAVFIFAFKRQTYEILLAPSDLSFVTYRWIEAFMQHFTPGFRFEPYHIEFIATGLSSQFMSHVTTSVYLGLLCASPYVLYELFRFVSPALYANERKYSVRVTFTVYFLFLLGVLMTYFILFPISVRFLGTYSVSTRVSTMITLDSYISTLVSLTLMMGVVFQLPILAFVLAKMGVIDSQMLSRYRRQAFIILMIVAAIITPPDVMTLILVSVPLYLLYEVSIWVVRICK